MSLGFLASKKEFTTTYNTTASTSSSFTTTYNTSSSTTTTYNTTRSTTTNFNTSNTTNYTTNFNTTVTQDSVNGTTANSNPPVGNWIRYAGGGLSHHSNGNWGNLNVFNYAGGYATSANGNDGASYTRGAYIFTGVCCGGIQYWYYNIQRTGSASTSNSTSRTTTFSTSKSTTTTFSTSKSTTTTFSTSKSTTTTFNTTSSTSRTTSFYA